LAPLASNRTRNLVVVALLVLGIGAMGAWLIRAQRDTTLEGSRVALTNLVRALDQHTARAVDSVDVILVGWQQRLQIGGMGLLTQPSAQAELMAQVERLPQVRALVVFDANGDMVGQGLRDPVLRQDINVADRTYFLIHRERHDVGLFIDLPRVSRISGESMIAFSQRLQGPDGSFQGIVMAALDPAYFLQFFQHLNLGEHGFISLNRSDSTLLLRWPDDPRLQERDLAGSSAWKRIDTEHEGLFEEFRADEPRGRMYGFRSVDPYSLKVLASLSRDDLLADWRRLALIEGGVVLAMIIAVLTVAALLEAQRRERARAERARHKSDSLFRALFDHATDWLFVQEILPNGTSRTEICNEAGAAYVKRSINATIGLTPHELVAPPVATMIDHEMQKTLAGGVSRRFEYPSQLHENRSYEVVHIPLPDEAGRLARVFVTVRDISHLKRAEQIARDSELRYRALADSSSDVILQFDANGIFNYASPALQELLGIDPKSVIGGPLSTVAVYEEDQPKMRAVLHALMNGQERALIEYRGLHADGRPIWLEANLRALRDDLGTVQEIVAVVRDVRRRKAVEEALLSAQQDAERANRAKSSFLANMSHELRSPLNAVIGFSQMLRQETHGSLGHPSYREYADDIGAAAEHLLSLINDILDFSKVEAGKLTLNEETIDVAKLLRQTMRMIAGRAEQSGVALELAIAPAVYGILADETRITQILLNLLTNAVKYTPSGGKVVVGATLDAGGRLGMSVSDTGIGIAPDDLALVLQPFAQVDHALNRQREGTGLGLPLTVRLIELHGGELVLDSQPGRGTNAVAWFPASRTIAPAGEAMASSF
jgi:PAS domain S-box-containing protein